LASDDGDEHDPLSHAHAGTLWRGVPQTLIYQRIGFTRILGVTHILWVPMFAWMTTRLDAITSEPRLANWLLLLFVTNLVSLVVDTIDAIRFLRGERAPYYRWNLADQT
jgi:hypothetical protein